MVAAFHYAAKLRNAGDLLELDQLKRREFITLFGGAVIKKVTKTALPRRATVS